MKTIFRLFLLSVIVLMNYSCEKDVQGAENGVRDMKINITVSDVTSASARIVLEPELQDESYYYSAMPKSEFDALGGDEGVKKADMEYFQNMADENGLDVSQIISGLLINGNEDEVYNNLKSETEYVVYAYSMDKDGESGATVSKTTFMTDKDAQNPSESMLKVEIKSTGMCEVSAVITPENQELMYYPDIIDENTYNEYGGNKDAIRQYFVETLENTAEHYGLTIEEVVQELWICGKTEKKFTHLNPESNYYCYAVVLESNGNVLDLAYEKAVTTERIMTDLELVYEVSNITSISFEVKIKPSDQEHKYFFEVWPKNQFDRYSSDEEVMQVVLDKYGKDIDQILYQGEIEGPVNNLPSNSDYVLIGFGYNGSYCTELFKQEVSTMERLGPEDFKANLEVSEITDLDATIRIEPNDPTIFYQFHYMKKEFADKYSSIEEAVQADFDSFVALWKEQYPQLSEENIIIQLGVYGNRTSQTGILDPSTDYIFWAAAFDNTGTLLSEASTVEFTTKEYIVNESVLVEPVLGKYFDGDALAQDLGYWRFEGLMVVYVDTVKVQGAKYWYTTFFKGDVSSKDQYPDHILAANLKRSGSLNIGSEPAEAYLSSCGTWTLSAVGIDEEGNFGPVYRQVIEITKEGAAGTDEYPMGGLMSSPENKVKETVLMYESERFGIDKNFVNPGYGSQNFSSNSFSFLNVTDDKALKPIKKKTHSIKYSNRIR